MTTNAPATSVQAAKSEISFNWLWSALRGFVDWERREANKLLPPAFQAWLLGRGAREAVVTAEAGEVFVADAPGAPGFRISGAEIASGSLDSALARRKLSRKGLAIALELPAKSFLLRHFDLPVAALSRLDALVDAEIERKTPFRRDEIFLQTSVQPHAERGKATVALTLLRRDLAAAALEGSGLPVDALALIRSAPGAELREIRLGGTGNDRGFFRAAGILAGFAALLLILGLAVDFWRQGEQAAELDARIADLAGQATKIRQSADRAGKESRLLERLREARRRNTPMTALWEEISRVTPDNAYLSDMRLSEGKDGERIAELTGLARSAVELPMLYGRSRYFSEATLTAPITTDPREKLESFSLRLKIRKEPAS